MTVEPYENYVRNGDIRLDEMLDALFVPDSGYEYIKSELENGFDVNIQMGNIGCTMISVSATFLNNYNSEGYFDKTFDLILSYHPNVNIQNKYGETALFELIDHLRIIDVDDFIPRRIKKLLDHGASCLLKRQFFSIETYKYTDIKDIFQVLKSNVSYIIENDHYTPEFKQQVLEREKVIYCLLRNRYCEEITLFKLMLDNIDLELSAKRQRTA